MGVSDALFDNETYDSAVDKYVYLLDSKHPLVTKRLDDIYLRVGYCYCQAEQWYDALRYFEALFVKFPDSDSIDKAVCMQYLAASAFYESNPNAANYARYIESIKMYLSSCSEPRNKDGAQFQLGKYYHDKGKTREASNEFSALLYKLSGQGVAVLMATHDLFRAKESGTRVGIMKYGKLVAQLRTEEICHTDLEKIYLAHMHD